MNQVPSQLVTAYQMSLGSRGVKSELRPDYLKWLRFFLGFCEKHKIEGDESDRLRQFITKLKNKGQLEDQRRQAFHAVTLYFALLKERSAGSHANVARNDAVPEAFLPELKQQIKAVGELHDRDLAAVYDGVFLDDSVERKYPKAPKEFLHQWFFPQKNLYIGDGDRSAETLASA